MIYVYSEIFNETGSIATGAAPLTKADNMIMQGGSLLPGLTFADANYHWHDVLTDDDCEFTYEVIINNINEADDTEGIIDLDDFVVVWKVINDAEMEQFISSWQD